MRRASRTLALTGAAVSLGVGGAALVNAAPASADPCPAGALCAYTAVNYGGDPGTVYGNNDNLLQYAKFDNAVSVFNNGRQCGVTIWNQTGNPRRGTSVYLPRGTGYGDLLNQNRPFYKNIAANTWC